MLFLLMARLLKQKYLMLLINRIGLQKCWIRTYFLYEYAVDICSYLNLQSCGYSNR